jgi:hypothetical protein
VAPWRNLLEGTDHPFCSTPSWFHAWWNALGQPDTEAFVFRGRAEVGALALLSKVPPPVRGGFALPKIWVNSGGVYGTGDHVDWAIADPQMGVAVRDWLHELSQTRSIVLYNMPQRSAPTLLPHTSHLLATHRCPQIDLRGFDASQSWSNKFRKRIRYYRRKADAAGITFKVAQRGLVDRPLLTELMALHDARWSASRQASAFSALHRQIMYELSDTDDGDGGLETVVARRQDGRPVGALLGLRTDTRFEYYQSGWDPECSDLNLGTLLVAESITHSLASGAYTFDFLRGPEHYKYRFGAQDCIDESWEVGRHVRTLPIRLRSRRVRT